MDGRLPLVLGQTGGPAITGFNAPNRVVPRGVRLERLAGGFQFTEGPVWHADGYLLFSDPNANTIYRWSPHGSVSVFRTKSGYTGVDIGRYHQPGSNGLTLDPDGRLTINEHGNRRVTRLERTGAITVLADRFEGNGSTARTTWSTAPMAPSISPTRRSGCRTSSMIQRKSYPSAASTGSQTAW